VVGARFAIVLAGLALLGACSPESVREEPRQMATFADVPDSSWAALAGKRVFFGHQSVGDDLMAGAAELLARNSRLGLRLAAGDSAADGRPALAHERIGRNGDPGGKSDVFAAKLEAGLGARVDVAMHKYCFADIGAGSDVGTIFDHYRAVMARLHEDYPGVVFVHVTTPLVTPRGSTLRMLAHRLLGRTPERIAGNLARERFNALMRKEYSGREPLFDLAAEESTRPDGSRVTVAWGGQRGYALYPGYSSDGSHLNEAGRRRIAEAMLVFLARVPAGSGATAAAR
jgi:hypothetical protein